MSPKKIAIQTLLSSRIVVPIEPADRVLTDHAIAIDNGVIVDVLPTERALKKYDAKSYVEYDDHILMPGLINAHTHAAMSLLRGVASDVPLMDWLNNHIWPLEKTFADEQFVHDGSQLAIAEMLRGGTTCFNDMYFFPEITARVASQMGMRAVVGMIVIEFPTRYATHADEYLSKGLALFDTYKNNPLITTIFAPHAPYTLSDDTLTKISRISNELDLPVHMHVHETAQEIKDSLELHGVRPLDRLDQLGLLNPNLLAVHMTQLTAEEITQIADAGVTVLHCPESNLKLASGMCPVHALKQAKARVIIGTDSHASNDDLDMFSEMRTAALLAKGVSQDATAFNAQQALRAATIDAARALGLGNEIGSIEKHKSADIIAIHCNNIESYPHYDVFSHLVYSTDRQCVCDVFVAGRQLLKDRTLTTASEDDIIIKSKQWQATINAFDASTATQW